MNIIMSSSVKVIDKVNRDEMVQLEVSNGTRRQAEHHSHFILVAQFEVPLNRILILMVLTRVTMTSSLLSHYQVQVSGMTVWTRRVKATGSGTVMFMMAKVAIDYL